MQKQERRAKSLKRGPKPDTLKIDGDWKKAITGALKKKRPAEGWPGIEKEQKKRPPG